MPTLYITVGPPASGKSFWAQSQNLPVVSTDAIRAEINGNESDQSNNEKVFSVARERVCNYLTNGQDVIYDATNMGYRNRKAMIATVRKLRGTSVRITACVFVVQIDELYERNSRRSRHVPEEVIDNMLFHFQPPCKWEGIDEIVYHVAEHDTPLSYLQTESHNTYMYRAAGGTPENAALIAYHELPEDMDAYDKMRKVMPIDFTYDLDLVHEADVRSRFV